MFIQTDTYDEDCGSAKHVAIWYQRGQKPFDPNIIWYNIYIKKIYLI